MNDKNGYEIKIGQDISFKRPGEIVEVLGEVVDFLNEEIIVQDEDADTFTLQANDLLVIMNRECNDCSEEFNRQDTETSMEEGVGKTLHEVPCCPYCRSIDIEEKSRMIS
jgi:hypothetical protein